MAVHQASPGRPKSPQRCTFLALPTCQAPFSLSHQTITSARRRENKEMGRSDGPNTEKARYQKAPGRAQGGKAGRTPEVCLTYSILLEDSLKPLCRRREITKERKQMADEKRRLEEAKAQVRGCYSAHVQLIHKIVIQMGARKAARLRRKAGRSKKINQ